MNGKGVGKLTRVPLREVWEKEAADFTQWLQENLDALNDALDFNLTNAEREQAAGTFSVDLVAEDDSGGTVVIENQLGKSDHDHLGKLITYLASFNARAAIWITPDPRPEHANAIAWLNQSPLADFYLVKVEAVKIGDSLPAALFTRVVGPSEEVRKVGKAKEGFARVHVERERFWTLLLDRSKGRTKLFENRKPNKDRWLNIGTVISGLSFYYYIFQDTGGSVGLYIDRGKGSEQQNLAILETLQSKREEIETEFQEPLEWEPFQGKRACYIRHPIKGGGWGDPDSWPTLIDAMIDAMIRFEHALKPHLKELKGFDVKANELDPEHTAEPDERSSP